MSQMRSYRSEPRAGIVRAHTDQAADTRPSFELVLLPTASHRRPPEPDLFFLPSPKRDLIGGFNGEYKKSLLSPRFTRGSIWNGRLQNLCEFNWYKDGNILKMF